MFVELTGDRYDKNDPGQYDPDHFYTLETGREQIQTRTSESVKRCISRLVEDPRFIHYQTSADFLRDAIVHRMHYWLEQVKNPVTRAEIEQLLEDERLRNRILSRKRDRATATEVADELVNQMRDVIAKGLDPVDSNMADIDRFIEGHADLLDRDRFTELYVLRLYFLMSPGDLLEQYPALDDTQFLTDYVKRWEMRQAYWPDHPDTDAPITADEVQQAGVNIRGIQNSY
jgi:hypothetical protein